MGLEMTEGDEKNGAKEMTDDGPSRAPRAGEKKGAKANNRPPRSGDRVKASCLHVAQYASAS